MGGIFGSSSSTPVTRYQYLNVQTSTQGLCIPAGWGKYRAAPNLIWYGDFSSSASQQSSGKGGGSSATSYNYSCAVMMGLVEGPVQGIGQVWADTTVYVLSDTGFSLFTGTETQEPWSYLTTKHPAQALSYAGTAYLANGSCQLGTSPDLPNFNYEVIDKLSGSMPGTVDANFGDIIPDYLTNPQYSYGFPSGSIDATSLAFFKLYQQAQNLFFSPYMNQQEQSTQTFQRWAQLSNSWIFWSGNVLKFVPLGDSPITANGVTYTPYLTPVYNLTYDDFIYKQGNDPIIVTRSDPSDGYNNVTIDCNDRSNAYNNTSILWQDQSSVDQYGQLMSQTISATEINDTAVAQICAALIGQRAVYIRNTYAFTLGYNYVLLEPGDIVTLNDPAMGLTTFPVRITNIQENKDSTLAVTAEECPAGIGTPALYTIQQWSGNSPVNTQVAPGNVNAPAIFEPNAALTGGSAEVWVGCSGGADWGGCEVYLSFDGDNYDYVGNVSVASIQGVLGAALPATADPDTTDTLEIDLTESLSTLPATATDADADSFRTLILVDNELMSYGSALPTTGSTNPYAFSLTYLRRGLYGTAVATHAAGAPFTRVNSQNIFSYALPEQYVGETLYLKFVSFNIFNNALQDISTVTEYTYVPTGTAFAINPPATPTGTSSATTQSDGTTILSVNVSWGASSGPNLGSYNLQYSTNGGTSWQSVPSLPASATSYSLTPALASTNYLFRIQAISQNGQAISAWETSATIPSGSLVTSVPVAPTGIAASAAAGGAMISWVPSASANTKGYQISYGTTNVFSAATLYSVTTSGTGQLVSGLTAGTLYYFWVQAYNGAGASTPDGPVSATPTGISAGVTVQQNGTAVVTNANTLNVTGAGATVTSVGGVPTINVPGAAGVSVTNGTLTVNPATILEIGSGLTMQAVGAMPTIVQSISGRNGSSGASLALANPVTPGNYLVSIVLGINNVSGLPLLNSSGSSFTRAAVYGAIATSTVSPAITGIGIIYIAEIAGVASIVTGSTGINASGTTYSFGVTQPNNYSLLLFGAPSGGGLVVSSPLPAGTSLIAEATLSGASGGGAFGVSSSLAAGADTISWVGNVAFYAPVYIQLLGKNSGVVSIGEATPVTINGVLQGSPINSMSVTTNGSSPTVSVVGNTLELGLGSGGGGGGGAAGLSFDYIGAPPANQELYFNVLASATTLPAGLTGAVAACAVAPTSAVSLPILHNSTVIGSINFAAGSTVGTFSLTGSVTFAIGDTLSVVMQSTTDATFETVAATLGPVGATLSTYNNVTSSRAVNTVYTNTTGKVIFLSLLCSTTIVGQAIYLYVNGLQVSAGVIAPSSGSGLNLYGWVNPGDTYELSITGGTPSNYLWLERYGDGGLPGVAGSGGALSKVSSGTFAGVTAVNIPGFQAGCEYELSVTITSATTSQQVVVSFLNAAGTGLQTGNVIYMSIDYVTGAIEKNAGAIGVYTPWTPQALTAPWSMRVDALGDPSVVMVHGLVVKNTNAMDQSIGQQVTAQAVGGFYLGSNGGTITGSYTLYARQL